MVICYTVGHCWPPTSARVAVILHALMAAHPAASEPIPAPTYADHLRGVPERPQARRYPDRGHQRVREPARLLRLGRAVRAHAVTNSTRWPRSSACTSSRWRMRATGISDPRSRSTATRCSRCCIPSRSEPAPRPPTNCIMGEVDVFVGPNYVLSVRHRTQTGFARRARAHRARARPPASRLPALCFYAVMDNVVDRYFPVLDALETELEAARGARCSKRDVRPRQASRHSTR